MVGVTTFSPFLRLFISFPLHRKRKNLFNSIWNVHDTSLSFSYTSLSFYYLCSLQFFFFFLWVPYLWFSFDRFPLIFFSLKANFLIHVFLVGTLTFVPFYLLIKYTIVFHMFWYTFFIMVYNYTYVIFYRAVFLRIFFPFVFFQIFLIPISKQSTCYLGFLLAFLSSWYEFP